VVGGTVAGEVPCLRNCKRDNSEEQQQHVFLFVLGINVDVIKHVVTFGFILMRSGSSEGYQKKYDDSDQRKRAATTIVRDSN